MLQKGLICKHVLGKKYFSRNFHRSEQLYAIYFQVKIDGQPKDVRAISITVANDLLIAVDRFNGTLYRIECKTNEAQICIKAIYEEKQPAIGTYSIMFKEI